MQGSLGLGLVILGLWSCADTQKGDKVPQLRPHDGAPITQASFPQGASGTSTGVLKSASLAGYPQNASPDPSYKITVSEVPEYKWKGGLEADTDCRNGAGYTAYQAASLPLQLDVASIKMQNAVIKLCVVGRSSSGEEQGIPTEVSWIWTPAIPAAYEQYELIDGDNQVKIIPKLSSGQWLVIRSLRNFEGKPEDGSVYTVNQRIANGVVIAAGNPSEVIDKDVKNLETWTYTIFASNGSRRYSVASSKSLTLQEQSLNWIRKEDIKPGYVGVSPLAGNPRVVCRSRHFDPGSGTNMGVHPGRTTMVNNGDIKSAQCLYEFAKVIYASGDFEVLMSNKGDPMNKLRWERSAGGTNGSFIPANSIIAGRDEIDTTPGQEMYICRGYTNTNRTTLESFGKVGPNLAGCRAALINDGSMTTERAAMDILVLKP